MKLGKPIQHFLLVAESLHHANLGVCKLLLALLFSTQFSVVVMRYLFAIGFVELQDFVLYCFATLSILGIPIALRLDKHVRVDIFRASGATASARRIDQISYALLLIPLAIVTIYYAMPLVQYSWEIKEGARETGGLGGYYLVMMMLPIACLLIIIQALALFFDKSLIHSEEVG